MPYMEDIIEEEKNAGAEPEDKQEPTPAEPAEPAEPDKPADDPAPDPKPDEPADPEDKGKPEGGDPAEPDKPKKDLSGLTKEQKAEFAFKRQMEKQRNKYESQLESMNGRFDAIEKLVKESLAAKAPEKPKTRADFPQDEGGDDAYIQYLAEQKVNAIMAGRDKEAAEKAAKEADLKKNEDYQQQVSDMYTKNVLDTFKDKEGREGYNALVNKGMDNGLAELLDKYPTVRNYVFMNPNGPRVLNAMLRERATFARVMGLAYDPTSVTIEMHELSKELRKKESETPPAQPGAPEPPKGMPHIGKPGSRQGTRAGIALESDADIIKFLRGVR